MRAICTLWADREPFAHDRIDAVVEQIVPAEAARDEVRRLYERHRGATLFVEVGQVEVADLAAAFEIEPAAISTGDQFGVWNREEGNLLDGYFCRYSDAP